MSGIVEKGLESPSKPQVLLTRSLVDGIENERDDSDRPCGVLCLPQRPHQHELADTLPLKVPVHGQWDDGAFDRPDHQRVVTKHSRFTRCGNHDVRHT